MNKIYFTTGPTALYPEVKKFISEALDKNVCSISHRSKEFEVIYSRTVEELKKLLNIPENFYVFFLSSATECMERIIQNLVHANSYHFINGYFAQRYFNISKQLLKNPEEITADYGRGFEFENIKIPEGTELACFTQNETSTGVTLEMDKVYELKKNNPEVLFSVDTVTAVPYYELDYNFIDCAFFSVQKGFGLPAGLGVLIVNQKCIDKTVSLQKNKVNIGSYNNFINLKENTVKNQTAVTPNVLGIYLLGRICEMLNIYGIDKIRTETAEKAKLIYEYFDKHNSIKSFVKKVSDRSFTTIVLETSEADEVIKYLSGMGYVLSGGYRDFKSRHIRIANFPMHNIDDIRRIINLTENFKHKK